VKVRFYKWSAPPLRAGHLIRALRRIASPLYPIALIHVMNGGVFCWFFIKFVGPMLFGNPH
jgi:hypothetical protein